jgi:hypothetical protein
MSYSPQLLLISDWAACRVREACMHEATLRHMRCIAEYDIITHYSSTCGQVNRVSTIPRLCSDQRAGSSISIPLGYDLDICCHTFVCLLSTCEAAKRNTRMFSYLSWPKTEATKCNAKRFQILSTLASSFKLHTGLTNAPMYS